MDVINQCVADLAPHLSVISNRYGRNLTERIVRQANAFYNVWEQAKHVASDISSMYVPSVHDQALSPATGELGHLIYDIEHISSRPRQEALVEVHFFDTAKRMLHTIRVMKPVLERLIEQNGSEKRSKKRRVE